MPTLFTLDNCTLYIHCEHCFTSLSLSSSLWVSIYFFTFTHITSHFQLGVRIGTTPGYFIIVPLLLTVLCASGFQQLEVMLRMMVMGMKIMKMMVLMLLLMMTMMMMMMVMMFSSSSPCSVPVAFNSSRWHTAQENAILQLKAVGQFMMLMVIKHRWSDIDVKETSNTEEYWSKTIFQYVWDPEYLLSPTTGPAKQERAAMEEVFPINYDYFQVSGQWHCLHHHDNRPLRHRHCHRHQIHNPYPAPAWLSWNIDTFAFSISSV